MYIHYLVMEHVGFLVFDFDNHEKDAEKKDLQIQMIHGLKKSKL